MSFLKNETGEVKVLWKVIALVLLMAVLCTGTFFLVQYIAVPEIQYAIAKSQIEAGHIEEGLRVFESLDGYRNSKEKILSIKYDLAVDLLEAGEYSAAAQAFRALGNYKDSLKKASEILFSVQQSGLVNVQQGDVLYFGHYEQDNNIANGTEELEWIVLDVVEGKALITTKYVIDSMKFHDARMDTTWETSSIRTWLNGTFYEQAFEEEHRKYISLTTVTADLNSEYDTLTGPETEDYVFLLSLKEFETYLSGKPEAVCLATEYAIAKHVYIQQSDSAAWWWCRTPGMYQTYVAGINPGGNISYNGNNADNSHGGIRPVIWLDLNV